MVKVYSFKAYDHKYGEKRILQNKSTAERIAEIPDAEIIPGTEEYVDPSELDAHGRYDPDKSDRGEKQD